MIHRMDRNKTYEFLTNQTVGRLGCVLENDGPYVVPVNYLVREQSIFVHTLPGKKLDALEANPKVCLQTDRVDAEGFEWTSVIVFGTFKKIEDDEERLVVLREIYKRFPQFTPVEATSDITKASEKIVVFRISIERLTGVSESV